MNSINDLIKDKQKDSDSFKTIQSLKNKMKELEKEKKNA